MPVNFQKYYRRIRKLILACYRNLAEENKQDCDLMLQYGDDLRLAHRITNGPTEGSNNKIKVLKRNSYGIRNFKRFRTRILHCTT